MGQTCVSRSRWPVVGVTVASAADLATMLDELEELVAIEQPFALLLEGPPDLAAWQRLLWASPDVRRRLRRLRPTVGTWCVGAAHVVDPRGSARLHPAALRFSELAWGCVAGAFGDRMEAQDWIAGHLARRMDPARMSA